MVGADRTAGVKFRKQTLYIKKVISQRLNPLLHSIHNSFLTKFQKDLCFQYSFRWYLLTKIFAIFHILPISFLLLVSFWITEASTFLCFGFAAALLWVDILVQVYDLTFQCEMTCQNIHSFLYLAHAQSHAGLSSRTVKIGDFRFIFQNIGNPKFYDLLGTPYIPRPSFQNHPPCFS